MNDDIEIEHGGGNVYRDHAPPNPAVCQLKEKLAAQFIKVPDKCKVSVREAHAKTGVATADFSRIRKAPHRRTADVDFCKA